MKGRNITQEDKAKIQEMLLYGMPPKCVAQLTGWSVISANRIKNGTHQKHLDDCHNTQKKAREADALKAENDALKDELAKANTTPIERGAGAMINVYGPESMLCRIADGIDYSNALLNGVLNKLEKLCASLGV